MKFSTTRNGLAPTLKVALGLALAAGLAPSALAQVTWSAGGNESAGSAGHATSTWTVSAPESASTTTSRTVLINGDDRTIMMSGTTDGGDRFEIKLKNDTLEAKLNGKRVPDDRIRISGSVVELLDEDGQTIVSMDTDPRLTSTVPPVPAVRYRASAGQPRDTAIASFSTTEPGVVTIASDPPKVMVGINMSDVDPTLREHFGLDEDAGFVIDNVVDGLPASNAGLQARDIIVSIDGKNVTNSTLRDTLNEKEPGQKVKVRILRKGERKDVEMVLQAYDASKLGIATSPQALTLDRFPGQTFTFGGTAGPEQDEARRAMEQAMRAMEEARAQMQGPQGEALRQAQEEMRMALEELRESQGRWLGQAGESSSRFFVVPSPPAPPSPASPDGFSGTLTPSPSAPRGYQVFRDPVGPASAAEAERMAQLEERLNQLNGRLDKLDDRIGKLLDRLERDN
jgi:membrane-associated protease RseP (regulator of RpoE activity)